ncbi:30S ribosomal protein S19e [Candidatus Woesearchaeota archaeon]|nr:MAG: 30S ribosomal protein S19e [Candidatus Woesearchaeota archaeon]
MYKADINQLLELTAKKLQEIEQIKAPEWAPFVKTGVHKERPPVRQDWWYIRAASILRTVRLKGPIGVNKLRVKYGGRKSRGYKPERFRKGSGNIIRKALQQLRAAGLIEQKEEHGYKGNVITGKGMSLLDQVAKEVAANGKK